MNPVQREVDSFTNGIWINSNRKGIFTNDAKALSTETRQVVPSSQNFSTASTGSASIAYYVSSMDTDPLPQETEQFIRQVFNEDGANAQIQTTHEFGSFNLESLQHSFSHDVLNDFSNYSSVPSSPSIEANSIGVPYVEQQIHSPILPNTPTYNIIPATPHLIRMILPPQTPPSPTGLSLKELIPIMKTNQPQFAKPTQKDVWDWLCSIQLKEYYQDFIDNGFDDLETIADLNEDEVRAVFRTSKFGHLKKLVTQINALKSAHRSSLAPNSYATNSSPQIQTHTLDLAEVQRTNSNANSAPNRHTKYTAKKVPPKTLSPGPASPQTSENDDNSTPATPSLGTYPSPNANIALPANGLEPVSMTRSSSTTDEASEAIQDETEASDIEGYETPGFVTMGTIYDHTVHLRWLTKGTKRKREDKTACSQNSIENPLQFVQGKKLQPFPLLEIQPNVIPHIHSIKIALWKCDIKGHTWQPVHTVDQGLSGETTREVLPTSPNNNHSIQIRFDKVKLNAQPKQEKKGYLYCFKFSLFQTATDEKPAYKITSQMFTILSHNSQRLKSPQSVALMSVLPDFGKVKTENNAMLFGHFPLIPDYQVRFDSFPAVINYQMHRPPSSMLSVFTPAVRDPCRVDIKLGAGSYHHCLPSSYSFLKKSEYLKRIKHSGNPDNNNDPSSSYYGQGNSQDGFGGNPNGPDPNNNNKNGGNMYFTGGGYQGGRTQANSTGEEGANCEKMSRSGSSDSQQSQDSSSSDEEDEISDSSDSSEDEDGSEDPQPPSKLNLSKINPKDVNVIDSFGFTLLHKATCQKDRDRVVHLLGLGADVNMQDREGYTPLMWAIAVQELRIAETLLVFHADPNIPDVYGLTPLHAAIGLPEDTAEGFVSLLIKYGADATSQDIYEETPMDYARELGKDKLLSVLENKEPAPMPAPEPRVPVEDPAPVPEPLKPAPTDPLTTPEPLPEPVKPDPFGKQKPEPLGFKSPYEKFEKAREYEISQQGISCGIDPDLYDSITKLTISKCPNLRSLPYNIALCRRLDQIQVDWRICNKVSDPPREVIEKGAFAVREYMQHVLSGETTTSFYGRSKIIVMGPSLAGKTSMLKVLNALRTSASSWSSRLFKPNPQDFVKLVSGGLRTLGVDVNNRETRFGDAESEFMTYDFGGEPEFATMYRHFISAENALYVITFDISADENSMYQQVIDWIEFLKLYIPETNFRENKTRLILIGNKVDKLMTEEVFRRLQNIRERTEQFINCPVIGTSCMRLQFFVIDLDGKRRTGDFTELSALIAREARKVNATARIPQLFKTIQDTIEWTTDQQREKSSDMISKLKGFFSNTAEDKINYIFSWEAFKNWCKSMGFDCDEKLLMQATDYLQAVGTAVVSKQTRAVCVDPRKFGKILGAFLAETTKSKLQFLEKDFENSGILESKMVPMIFEKLLSSHGDFTVHADDSDFILDVMANYDLCFRLPKSEAALFPSLRRSGKPAFPVVLRNKTDRMETNAPDRIICFSIRIACEPGARSFFRSFQIGLARDFVFQAMFQDSVSVKDKTDTWLLASLHKEAVNVVIMGEQPAKMSGATLEKIRQLRNDEFYQIQKLCPKCCFEDPMATNAYVMDTNAINQQKLLKCPIHGKLAEEPKLGYKIPDDLQSSANQLLNVRTMEEIEVNAWELYTPSLNTSWDKWGQQSYRRMILKKPFPKKSSDATEERYQGVLASDIPEIERVETAWKSLLGSRIGEFEITKITVLQNPQQEKIFHERWMQVNAQGLNRSNMDADYRMQTFVSECSKLYHCNSQYYSNANSFTSLKANLAIGWWNGKNSHFPLMADNTNEYTAIENGINGKGYYMRPYPLYSQDYVTKLGYETDCVMLSWVLLGNCCTVEASQPVPSGNHDSVFRVFPETSENPASHEITVFDKDVILPRYVVHYRLMNAALWIDDHHHTNNQLSIQKIQEYGTHVFIVNSKEEARQWLSNRHNMERYRILPVDRFRIICNKALMIDSTSENRLGANSLYGFIRTNWSHTPVLIYCGKYEDRLWRPDERLYITTDPNNTENFALMEPLTSIRRSL